MFSTCLQLGKSFHNSWMSQRLMHVKRARLYQRCYRILGVDDSSDQNAVRCAYINLVKRVHPDTGLPEASAERFQEVDEAFKMLQEKFGKSKSIYTSFYEEDYERDFDIRDGIGVHNPFLRRKYQQAKARRAQERANMFRIKRTLVGERALVKRSSSKRSGYKRLLDYFLHDSVLEAGIGHLPANERLRALYLLPLIQSQLQLQFDCRFKHSALSTKGLIQNASQKLYDMLRKKRARYGPSPLAWQAQTHWDYNLANHRTEVEYINKSIALYNALLPQKSQQLRPINLMEMSYEILNDPYLPRKPEPTATATEMICRFALLKVSSLLTFVGSLF